MSYSDGIIDALFAAHGVPRPEREHQFHSERKWRFDLAWPEVKLACEIEGGAWTGGRHTRGKGFVKDLEKYNEAICMGWTVIRVTPQMLEDGQAGAWVRRILDGLVSTL